MEYEIMFLCNTLGIAIIGMIVVYHLIGTMFESMIRRQDREEGILRIKMAILRLWTYNIWIKN